jgi:hypothetical protein
MLWLTCIGDNLQGTPEQKLDFCFFKAEQQINLRMLLDLFNRVHGDPSTPHFNQAVLPIRQATEHNEYLE